MDVNSNYQDAGIFWDAAIQAAVNWREKHVEHVRNLEATAARAYPPSGSDIMRPVLWKAEHWRWLKEIVNV